MRRLQSHLPINHPAQPVLRILAGLAGLYILVFGVAGLVETWGAPVFDRSEVWVLGLRTNPAFSVLSIVAGGVVVGGAVYGRNLGHFINFFGGTVFVLAGLAMMTVLHTPLNILNYSMRNAIVSFIVGLVMLVAGLYGRVGSPDAAYAEEQFRHGELVRRELGEQPGAPPGRGREDQPGEPEQSSGESQRPEQHSAGEPAPRGGDEQR